MPGPFARLGRRAVLHNRARIDRFKLASRAHVRARLLGDATIGDAVRAHAAEHGIAERDVWATVDTYVREMAIPEPLASVVATRTLVVLGQDLVPYRRRAVDGGEEAVNDRPKLRLNDASQGRQPPGQRTIKRA